MGYSLFRSVWDQAFSIPKPNFTEDDLDDQTGRVSIVTGYIGCGYELAKILYKHNATIYLAGRNPEKGQRSVQLIQGEYPESQGHIEFLKVDLADLSTVKPAVEAFLSKSNSLHCLTNNAGVMMTPSGSKTAQGHELQMGTNCLGPYLFTKLLLPILQSTAQSSSPGTVRVTWASSLASETLAPKGGIAYDAHGTPKALGKNGDYAQSKVGNIFLAKEFAQRYGNEGLVSVAWNPGNLDTDLGRHLYRLQNYIISKIFLYPPKLGAYTELFAGYSSLITLDQNGAYIFPWGRIGAVSPDVHRAMIEENGGSTKLWEWCDKETSKWTQ